MSTTKISKESSSKKTTPDANKGKVESVAKTTDTSTVDKAGSSTADKTANKAEAAPKSASQASLSHFSSVSTPQYRSGWNNIFGDGSDVKKIVPKEVSQNDFPKKFNVLDYDIDLILRDALDVAFNDVLKKRGINLKDVKELVRFEYNLICEIKEK